MGARRGWSWPLLWDVRYDVDAERRAAREQSAMTVEARARLAVRMGTLMLNIARASLVTLKEVHELWISMFSLGMPQGSSDI